MPAAILPYEDEFVERVADFNGRLRRRGVRYQFPETSVSERLPKCDGRDTWEEGYVLVDNGTVRGGYLLKHQPFWLNGEMRQIGCMRLPLSEGIINRAYLTVGARLFADAVRRQPLLYGLGIGGMDEAVARLMVALGWSVRSVPFFFRVRHAGRLLRGLTYLRTSRWRSALLDAAAVSGVAGACLGVAQNAGRIGGRTESRLSAHVPADPDDSWQNLWEKCRDEYTFIGSRDTDTLAILYPSEDRFIRMKVTRDGEPLGWAVLLATQMEAHKQFGNLYVGSIVDCLAPAKYAQSVIAAATRHLEQMDVDLIVSNQSASHWVSALRRNGYLRGPSNFLFGASRELTALLDPLDQSFDRIHMTRGDGEGPNNL